jgi:hypothetical protein
LSGCDSMLGVMCLVICYHEAITPAICCNEKNTTAIIKTSRKKHTLSI